MKIKLTRFTTSLLKHAMLILGSLAMIIPFLWMISTSLKPPTEVLIWPPKLIPGEPTLANYAGLFKAAPFGRFFLNSVLISTVSTISILVTSLIAGFVFAKYRFFGRNFLFMLILATAIVPFESFMIPLYIQLMRIHWINTYQGVVLPLLIMSFGIFLMRQHIASAIPDELLDAARIDGCSDWGIFTRIIVPLSSSAIGALGIFAFIEAWRIFIWPLLIAQSEDIFNMELGLTVFQFRFSVEYGMLTAGSVLSVIPMIIAFVILRRRIIESVALTGLKG